MQCKDLQKMVKRNSNGNNRIKFILFFLLAIPCSIFPVVFVGFVMVLDCDNATKKWVYCIEFIALLHIDREQRTLNFLLNYSKH